jgi:hypothetical protein
MDRTLREYLQQADDLHEYLEKYCIALTAEQIEEKIIELQTSIKSLQTVAYQLANISNIANRVVLRKRKAKKSITDKKSVYVDPYPKYTDVGTLRTLYPVENKELIKGVQIPVKIIESVKEIPVSHLYYVRNINQYALNVEGIIIRGDLCNIVDYQSERSAKCEYGINCKCFTNKTTCPYYHDPDDFIYHGLEVEQQSRNFTVGSWIYSKKKTPKTYFARHLGSKDRLIYDLNTLKRVQYKEEISNREGQLIHDLLIYMILNARGLLERYPKFDLRLRG